MERFLYNQLKNWKDSKTRKPLILEGARQVGKTWLLKQFGLSLLVPGDFNHSVTGEKSQKVTRGNDQNSHLTPPNYSIF